MIVYCGGRLIAAAAAQVSVFDHAYLYGDSVYETVRAYHGKIFQWREHFRRLKASAIRIGVLLPLGAAEMERILKRVLRANQEEEATLRITLSRGPGPLGLSPASCLAPHITVLLHPQRDMASLREKGVRLLVARVRKTPTACLEAHIKSGSLLSSIQAKREADRAGAFEALLLSVDDALTEGTVSNVFWMYKGRVYTPSLACGLLAGVTRKTVLQMARNAGLPVREGRYEISALRSADEIFLTNSTVEVLPVTNVIDQSGGRKRVWNVSNGRPGPLTQKLAAHYTNRVQGNR